MQERDKDSISKQEWEQLRNLVEALDFDEKSFNHQRREEFLPYGNKSINQATDVSL